VCSTGPPAASEQQLGSVED